jgi:hypothetical protein
MRKGGVRMAISFSCPSCKAHVQVGDELAGQTGQCPRCERLIIIPSNTQPMPILLDADGNPVPIFVPVKMAPSDEPKAKSSRYDEPRRARRRAPVEKKPAGPMWPWALGILAGIAATGLLFSSFIVLCAYRPPQPSANVQIVEMKRAKAFGVLFGKLDGNRVTLQDGVFQVRAALTRDDPVHLDGRYKAYKVELRANVLYEFEVASEQFPPIIHLEDNVGRRIGENRVPKNGSVASFHVPQFTNTFTVVATSANPAMGEFTLTIREAHRMKPPVR